MWKLEVDDGEGEVEFKLQWSHNNSVVETQRFLLMGDAENEASMEPQQFSCGNYFMILALDKPHKLQWSHNNSVVETPIDEEVADASPSASMEPQQFSCGNKSYRIAKAMEKEVLQWSHNNSVVETKQ